MSVADTGIATDLGPFIAWLASREKDEDTRRRHRAHVQAYLEFVAQHDDGPPSADHRRAWKAYRPASRSVRAEQALALDRYDEWRLILRRTRIPR